MDASMSERVEQLAEEIAGAAQTQEDLNSLMRLMMKSALQRMLDTELDVHLGRRADPGGESKPAHAAGNRRNGYSQKTVQGDMGKLALDIPRDRQATFDGCLLPPSSFFLPHRSADSVASPSTSGGFIPTMIRPSRSSTWRSTKPRRSGRCRSPNGNRP